MHLKKVGSKGIAKLKELQRIKNRDRSYGVGVLYVVSYLSRIYPYFSNCSV